VHHVASRSGFDSYQNEAQTQCGLAARNRHPNGTAAVWNASRVGLSEKIMIIAGNASPMALCASEK
jgi:hypothetical protein